MRPGLIKKKLAGVVLITSVSGGAHAADLFADNFDRADGTDLNAETAGKSGSLGALDWLEVGGGAERQDGRDIGRVLLSPTPQGSCC